MFTHLWGIINFNFGVIANKQTTNQFLSDIRQRRNVPQDVRAHLNLPPHLVQKKINAKRKRKDAQSIEKAKKEINPKAERTPSQEKEKALPTVVTRKKTVSHQHQKGDPGSGTEERVSALLK